MTPQESLRKMKGGKLRHKTVLTDRCEDCWEKELGWKLQKWVEVKIVLSIIKSKASRMETHKEKETHLEWKTRKREDNVSW